MATLFRSTPPYTPPSRCPTPLYIPSTENPEESSSVLILYDYDPMVRVRHERDYSIDFENMSRAPTPGYSPVQIPHDWPPIYGAGRAGYLTPPKSRSKSPCSSSGRTAGSSAASSSTQPDSLAGDDRIDPAVDIIGRVSEYLERYVQATDQDNEMQGVVHHSRTGRPKPRRKVASVHRRKLEHLQAASKVT